MRDEKSLDVRKCPRDRCRWGEYLLVSSRLGIEPRQETNEEGKKRYYLTQCLCVLASVGRPWVDQWISLQASTHNGGGRGGAGSGG